MTIIQRLIKPDNEPAVIEVSYDGTYHGFTEVRANLRNNVELKALGTYDSIMKVLDTIQPDFTFVNSIIFQRTGRNILRINLEGGIGDSSLLFEIRDDEPDYKDVYKSVYTHPMVPTIIGVMASFAVIGVVSLGYWLHRLSKP